MKSWLSLRDGLLIAGAAIAVAAGFLAYEWRVVGHVGGLPLDDSWIHMQFARNLATGGGFSFNAGEPVSGSTAPLWTLLLSLAHALPGDAVLTAKGFGLVLLWLQGLLTISLARAVGLGPRDAMLAGVVVVLTPRLVWGSLSAMEIGLYASLATAGVWAHVARRDGPSWASTALFGLATLARPECLLLFPLAVLDDLRQGIHRLRPWTRHVLLFAALLAPAVLFNLIVDGRPLPNTYYAKVGDYSLFGALRDLDLSRIVRALLLRPLEQTVELARFAAENHVLLAALAPLGLLQIVGGRHDSTRRSSWLIPMALIAFPIVRGILAPYKGAVFQNGRYAAHLVPLLTVSGFVGLRAAGEMLARVEIGRWRQSAAIAVRVVIVASLFVQGTKAARSYAWDVDNIERMHVTMGRWLQDHTPADAVVATHDIGALGYFSGRHILDTAGLVTPEALGYTAPGETADAGVLRYLQTARPDYVVMLPNWYPALSQNREVLQPIHEITVARATVSAGARMVVYETDWSP